MAKLPFLLFRSLRLSHNSTCLCIEKCVRQSEGFAIGTKVNTIENSTLSIIIETIFIIRQFKNETHQPQELTKKGSSGTV